MAEVKDPERKPARSAALAPDAAPDAQRFPGRRRLLVASIGAATIHYATACADGNGLRTVVANLMAAPRMPPAGAGGPNVRPPGTGGTGQGGAAGMAGGDAGMAGAG